MAAVRLELGFTLTAVGAHEGSLEGWFLFREQYKNQRWVQPSVLFLSLTLKIDKITAFDFRPITSRNTHSPLVLAMMG